MKFEFLKFLADLGIGYKYLINGFIGALVWSLYKKLRFIEALRQIIIGSLVAGYITPLIAYSEKISAEYMSALSFIVGMLGMILIDSVYKYLKEKVKIFDKFREYLSKEKVEALSRKKPPIT